MKVSLLKVCVVLTTLVAISHAAPDIEGNSKNRTEPRITDDIKRGVVFNLYTRQNPEDPEIINIYDLANSNATSKYFDPKKPIKFCIHGWQSNGVSMTSIAKGFLEQGDYNVINVDWKKADKMLYPVARLRVSALGKWISYFLDLLGDLYDLDPNNIHLVGHSLGAHISGIVGNLQNSTIGRITGLDPAGPLFPFAPDRLTHESAQFVDVIHTCGNIFGFWSPMGHVDFYPNGGICTQPGCLLDPRPSCSHNRAMAFYAESLTSETGFVSWPFWGGPQGDFETNSEWVLMGDPIDKRARGVYYVKTNLFPPYAIPPTEDNFVRLFVNQVDKKQENPSANGYNAGFGKFNTRQLFFNQANKEEENPYAVGFDVEFGDYVDKMEESS